MILRSSYRSGYFFVVKTCLFFLYEWSFSQVSVRNVYVFPGIPALMERAFTGLEQLFATSGTTFHSREVTPSSCKSFKDFHVFY